MSSRTTATAMAMVYIDRRLIHKVSSLQAFAGLITENRKLRRVDAYLAVADHAVPTLSRTVPLPDGRTARQVNRLLENAKYFSIPISL